MYLKVIVAPVLVVKDIEYDTDAMIYHVTDDEWLETLRRGRVLWQFPLKMQQPWNPPSQESPIPRYLAVQIQFEMYVKFEFVPNGLSFWILRISGM